MHTLWTRFSNPAGGVALRGTTEIVEVGLCGQAGAATAAFGRLKRNVSCLVQATELLSMCSPGTGQGRDGPQPPRRGSA